MTRNEQLNFELLVGEIIEDLNTKDADKLERLSEELHEAVESAFYDFCMDNDIEEYSPQC